MLTVSYKAFLTLLPLALWLMLCLMFTLSFSLWPGIHQTCSGFRDFIPTFPSPWKAPPDCLQCLCPHTTGIQVAVQVSPPQTGLLRNAVYFFFTATTKWNCSLYCVFLKVNVQSMGTRSLVCPLLGPWYLEQLFNKHLLNE